MKLELLEDRIAVVPLASVVEKIGSLHVPDTVKKNRPNQGIVKFRSPHTQDVRVGDHVLFSSYVGTKVTFESEGELVLLRESAIDAIIGDGDIDERLLPTTLVHQVLRDMDIDVSAFDRALHARTVANFEF